MPSIGSPARVLIATLAVCQLDDLTRRDIHDEDIVVARVKTLGPGKCNMLSIRMPRRVDGFKSEAKRS